MSMTKPCVLVMPITLVPYVWSCLTVGVMQERIKASHAISTGHDHHYNYQNCPVLFLERGCQASFINNGRAALIDPRDVS